MRLTDYLAATDEQISSKNNWHMPTSKKNISPAIHKGSQVEMEEKQRKQENELAKGLRDIRFEDNGSLKLGQLCPHCGGKMDYWNGGLQCDTCHRNYSIKAGGPGSGRHATISRATKLAFNRGGSVRFGHDGSIYVTHRNGNMHTVLHKFEHDGDSYKENTSARGSKIAKDTLRNIPTPEPENQEGLDSSAVEETIGVDFDGTLAHYTTWKGNTVLGKPIPAMVKKVRQALKAGKQVVIFTARVANGNTEAQNAIKQWSKRYLGQELPVTNEKTSAMTEIWDDRARRVKRNQGVFATMSDWNNSVKKAKCPKCSSKKFSLMPTDFETAKCQKCGKLYDINAGGPGSGRKKTVLFLQHPATGVVSQESRTGKPGEVLHSSMHERLGKNQAVPAYDNMNRGYALITGKKAELRIHDRNDWTPRTRPTLDRSAVESHLEKKYGAKSFDWRDIKGNMLVNADGSINWSSPLEPSTPDYKEAYFNIQPIPISHPPSLKNPIEVKKPTSQDGWHKGDSKKSKDQARKDLAYVHSKLLRQLGKPAIAQTALFPLFPNIRQEL